MRLVALSLVAMALAVLLGMPGVSLEVALSEPESWQARAFWQLQLPRVLLAFATGLALSTAGAVMQGILRNPLADPYILGVSGGAAVGSAGVALVLGGGAGGWVAAAEPLGGFAGALGAFGLVLAFGRGGGDLRPLRMLLAGIVVNAMAGAALMIFAALGEPGAVQRTLVRLMGSVGVDPASPLVAPVVVVVAVVGFALVWPSRRALDLLALGDETARSLGVDPARLRRRLLVLLSLVVGVVVAATGLIGFVGLVVPHAVRLWRGPAHAGLIPLAAVLGGVTVVLSDAAVSRLAAGMGSELPVGVVTAVLGGPIFLWLLGRHFRAGFGT